VNSLPRLFNLASELASRDAIYAPAMARVESLLFASLHSGHIDRRATERILSSSKDDLHSTSTPDLLKDITETLQAEKVGMVGSSAEQYNSADELLSLFSRL